MSSINKFAAWLLTETGRKFSYFFAGTVSTGVLLGNVLPHTILLDQYKDFVHLYRKGFTVPLTDKLKQRFQKALDLAKIDPQDRKLFKPFACYGFDVFSAGTIYSKYGVIIGLPANFFYSTVNDIDRELIKIRDASVVWESDEGILLSNSLVLSEKAQLYAMVREIKFRETPKIIIDTIVSSVTCAGVYGLSHSFNQKLNLYVKPLPLRLILYTLVTAFGYGSWALIKDSSQIYYEMKIDKEIKESSPMLCDGGREYYTKLLQRNKALRKLLGKEGESRYTVLGNENYWLRQKHIPLVDRQRFFEEEIKLNAVVAEEQAIVV